MTAPAYSVRNRRQSWARTGWWLVIAGWLIQIPAAAGAMFVSDVLAALSLLGAACVAVGAYLLRGKGAVWLVVFAILGGVVIFAGLAVGSAALANGLWGKSATCQVAGVIKNTYDASHTTSDDRGGTNTTTEKRTRYLHAMSCPAGMYTVSADSPRPVGSKLDVIYAPRGHRGSQAPVFADQNRGDMAFAGAALGLGGLVELLLPIVAWRRGRRAPAAPPPPPPPGTYASGGPPYAPSAPPYLPGRPYGSPAQPYPPGRPNEPVPLESPRFEQAVRDSMGPSMSPGERVALPFVVRLLRRRMGVKEAPPPNPLAGRYQGPPPQGSPPQAPPPQAPPPQAPPPQGPRVDRPPPYEQWPDDRPPGQSR